MKNQSNEKRKFQKKDLEKTWTYTNFARTTLKNILFMNLK